MQTVEFVEALLNLGYSLVQVHPTVDGTNGTEVANWVETLLEQGDIRVAAAGLSEFLSGIEPLPEKVKALQYAGRLVKVAEAVDDPTLDQQVLKAEFLSHLVNLGGAYTAVMQGGPAPDYQVVLPNSPLFKGTNFFLDILWSSVDEAGIEESANELVDYYRLFDAGKNTHTNRIAALKLQIDILHSAERAPYQWNFLSEPFLLAPLFVQNGDFLSVNSMHYGDIYAQSNPYIYTGKPPWEAKATKEEIEYVSGKSFTVEGTLARSSSPIRGKVYAEQQRLWAWKIVKDYAQEIEKVSLEYHVTPEAIAGAILWEAIENPYPLYRAAIPQGLPGAIPIASMMGIPGKIHVTQINPLSTEKTVAAKLEDEGRVAPLSRPGDWKERAKRLSDPQWAIRYIAAILDRAADIYEEAAKIGQKRDFDAGRPIRDFYNIRDQAGILGALYQGGREEERAQAFEVRRDRLKELKELRQLLENGNVSEPGEIELVEQFIKGLTELTTPQLPEEKMGPWISQYRWLIRDRLQIYGIQPFGIRLIQITPLDSNNSYERSTMPIWYQTPLQLRAVSQDLLIRSRTEGKYE